MELTISCLWHNNALFVVWMLLALLLELAQHFQSTTALSTIATPRPVRSSSRPISTPLQQQRFKIGAALQRQNATILIDVENVRGKSGFALSHHDLFLAVSEWTQQCQIIGGQVILLVDHGSVADAFWTASNNGLAVVFAGPTQKADDVLANTIGSVAHWTQPSNDVNYYDVDDDHHCNNIIENNNNNSNDKRIPVLVVTDDQGLLKRCRKSTARKCMEVVKPIALLEELESINHNSINEINHNNPAIQQARHEIQFAAQWLLAYSKVQAVRNKHIPNKRRKALQDKVLQYQRQLEATEIGTQIYQFLKNATSIANNDNIHQIIELDSHKQSISNLDREIQSAIMTTWSQLRQSLRHRSYRKEKTDDRVVLAEQFRQELMSQFGNATEALYQQTQQQRPNSISSLSVAQRYVYEWMDTHPTSFSNSQQSTGTLRLVVVADTHGMERELEKLPAGDVLLHLGDFALEGPAKALSVRDFDQWLSEQTHRHKIVLRGNHDPRSIQFSLSGAQFVTSPRAISIAGFKLGLVPFLSKLPTKCLPPQCDIVASHLPPKGVLDECTSGKRAGSNVLRRQLQQMSQRHMDSQQNRLHKQQPQNDDGSWTSMPAVVLCGHIHESRGWICHDFSGRHDINNDNHGKTLVVNAANANPGYARSMDHAPVVVELSRKRSCDDEVNDDAAAIDIMLQIAPEEVHHFPEKPKINE